MSTSFDLNEVFKDKIIKFQSNLLQSLSDYELKVYIFLLFSSNSKHIFKGNLARICSWLRVKSNTVMNRNIKEAIYSLSDQGLISYSMQGKEWIITLSEISSSQTSNLKKSWITEILNYNKDEHGGKINKSISISWIQIFKVFVYTIVNCNGELITSSQIAYKLGISRSTVSEAFRAIEHCCFEGLVFEKETQTKVRERYNAGGTLYLYYECLGSEVRYLLNAFEL